MNFSGIWEEDTLSNVTKRDLVLDIAKSTGFTHAQIKEVVDEFFDIVGKFLDEGKKIEVRGFGTFYAKERKPRIARNPKTGTPIQLSKSIAPLFKFSSEIKDKLNEIFEVQEEQKPQQVDYKE